MNKKVREMKGITLIALVITIVVLLILAGVSIAMLTGENGILTQAQKAKEETEQASIDEQRKLAQVEATMNLKNTEYKGITIPAGFAPTRIEGEDTIENGLVIIGSDGSEFVWVPVDSNLRAAGIEGKEMAVKTTGTDENGRDNYQGKLYNFAGTGDATTSKLKTGNGQGTIYYREPSVVTGSKQDTYADVTNLIGVGFDAHSSYYKTILNYNSAVDFGKDMQKDYNEMIESIKTFGGFYIGRYETSINGETVASTKGNVDTRPMASINWYNMYKKQKEYASKNSLSSVKSSMIWGSQWDAMLNWALTGNDKEKVTATTNASHNLSSTYQPGTQYEDKINNIYDLEGNVTEWTLEAAYTASRVLRGR